MGGSFRHDIRVRYSECDVQGVVFNANYLSYFDISMTELWRAAFGSYQAMMDRGFDLVVAEAQIRFERPARFDDQLTLEVAIEKLGQQQHPHRPSPVAGRGVAHARRAAPRVRQPGDDG